MLFITTGMGGGTGSGAAPIIAKAAKDKGILTVAVVTKPFDFEGKKRMNVAEKGLSLLKQCVDTLIVIPNQNLFKIANEKTTFAEAFKMADDVLYQGVCGITDLITNPGMINLDFADIKTIMGNMGKAMMGTGESSGEERAKNAAQAALNNPLLDDSNIQGAKSILLNIQGGPDMALFEVDEAASKIRNEVDENANIIFGSSIDESLEGIIKVSVVATGMNEVLQEKNEKVIKDQSENFSNLASDMSFISKSNEIIIEDNNTNLPVQNEEIEQIDLESQINALEIESEIKVNNSEYKKLIETDISKSENEDMDFMLEKRRTNIFKRMSSFFVNKETDEKYLHPNINQKNKLLENDQNKEIEIVNDKDNEISEKLSNNADLFEIETKSTVNEHQIDLISMDQESEEIDEKVLEIPAFLRRQAN
jgi:cell division protein FtsZ